MHAMRSIQQSIRQSRWLLPAALLLLAACKPAAAPAPPLAAAGDYADSGLSLRLPEGWQVRERQGSLRVIAQPLRDGQPVADVWFFYSQDRAPPVADGAPPPGLDSYVERRESLIQKVTGISGYRVLDSSSSSVDGVAARRQRREYTLAGKTTRALSVMTVRGRCGYELVGAAPAADYARWQPAFTAVIDSLRWLPPTADCRT